MKRFFHFLAGMFFALMGKCPHSNMGLPYSMRLATGKTWTYRCCLDCGARVEFDLWR